MRLFKPTNFRLSFLISLVFAILILVISGQDFAWWFPKASRFMQGIEYRAFDQKFLYRGKRNVPNQVVIAAIDEKSVNEIGRWPWPRTKMAQLIEKLNALDAQVIAFDIVFSEPDRLGVYGLLSDILARLDQIPKLDPRLDQVKKELVAIQGQWDLLSKSRSLLPAQKRAFERLNRLQGKSIDRLLDELSKQKAREEALSKFEVYLREERERVNADRILAETIQEAQNVVLGYFFLNQQEVIGLKSESYDDFSTLAPSALRTIGGYYENETRAKENLETPLLSFEGVRPNIKLIVGETGLQGFFNSVADSDGIYRRTPLIVYMKDQLYPSLNLQAVQLYFQRTQGEALGMIVPFFKSEEEGLKHIRTSLPYRIVTDRRGWVFYNWYGRENSIPRHSIIDILDGKISKEEVAGKIVLVGPTARAIADLRTTPFGDDFPGVEMHATLIGNFLNNDFLIRDEEVLLLEVLFMLIAGTLLGVIVGRMRYAILGFVFTVFAMVGFVLFDYYFLFLRLNYWFRPIFPLMGMFSVYVAISLKGFIAEELAKRKIKKTFDVYVSPHVVDQMLHHPDKFRLGGERKELTVFFSDIRGFTALSERMEPEELVHFLNEYLTPMTDIVLKYDGTLDKYIGDAIMGFWGAPIPQKDHALRACTAALEMKSQLKNLQRDWGARNLPQIEVGMGINTGLMSVGNMGSQSRFSYTVMGDEVNLASRLEGLCKEYGSSIIIGEKTAKALASRFIIRPLDRVRVKGKERPEAIYELMGDRQVKNQEQEKENQALVQISNFYEEGLELFWSRQWQEAEKTFQRILELDQTDKATQMFLDQIALFKENAPSPEWDGVRVMKTK